MPDRAPPVRPQPMRPQPVPGPARWPTWRTDGGQWFADRNAAAAAALLEPTHRYGPAPVPAALPALLAWLNAWPARGYVVELTDNLAGIPPAERNTRELLARGQIYAPR